MTGPARRVALLPDDVANQIAAGEVVERPASVVKELVENALDAGASRIDVELLEAGRGLIRVVDDGSGMASDDAALAVLRHATSKLSHADDLLAIETLGFRGEALPSMASVSRFTLVTRRAEDAAATRVDISGGAPPEIRECAAPVGTRVEVADLFYNVPARRKFLKSDATESAQVTQLLQAFALGYPQVHFRLAPLVTASRPAERPTLDHPAVPQLRDRAAQVLGRELLGRLHEVEGDHGGVSLLGFASSPQAAKSHANLLYLFVNGRRIRDRGLHHAVIAAYGADLPAGRFPQAVLYLHLPPSEVDVNVHPAKAEVRFAHPSLVHQVVFTALRRTLERRPWLAATPLPLDGRAPSPQVLPLAEPRPLSQPSAFQPSLLPWARPFPAPDSRSPAASLPLPDAPPGPVRQQVQHLAAPWVAVPARAPVPSAPVSAPAPSPSDAPPRLVGALATGHQLLELPDGLAIVDPVAVGRDLIRATLAAAAARDAVPSKPLVMPVMLDVPVRAARLLTTHLGDLGRLGLWIEPFGGQAFQILGLPAPLAGQSARDLALAAVTRLERNPSSEPAELIEALARATRPEVADPVTVYVRWHALPSALRTPHAVRIVALDRVLPP